MINVDDNFKIDIRTYGRQFDIKLKANNEDLSGDDLNYVKPSFNTSFLKTIMHQIEIDSNVYIPKKTKITGKIGVKVNEKTYNYIDLNTYYVKSCERQEDTNSYRILAYTKMQEAMIDNELTLTEKLTVRNYLIAVCQKLNWNTDNIPETFINSDKLVDPTLHMGIGYTYRDILDEIATITCSFLLFKGDNLYLIYPTETNQNIDESYLDEDNITIGEKCIINSLVFSRAEGSDNIFRKDDESIATNGLHECRISDNQLLSTNDRSDYIDAMFDYLKTLEFYIFDIKSKGILFLEACDIFNLVFQEKTYKTILLNNEINLEDGLSEGLYLDEPDETQTEYKYADTTDKRLNKLYIIANKQEGKITLLSSQVSETEKELDSISTPTALFAGKSGTIESAESNLDLTEVRGESTQNGTPSPDSPVEIESVTSVTITSTGKNLLNEPSLTIATVKANVQLNLKAGTYVLSVENIETAGTTASLVSFNLADGTTDYYYLSNSSKSKIVTFNSDITSYNIYSQNGYNASIDVTAVFTNLMLRQENTSAEYEPHVSNQANIDLLHPLRSLLNGVCDRIYKKYDKWYDEQNIKNVIYNGTETGWTYSSAQDKDNTVYFQRTIEDRATKYGFNTVPLMCNRLVNRAVYYPDQEGVYLQSSNGVLMVRLNKSRLSEVSLAGFLAWLAKNNLEVQYELAAPISTEITDASIITELENIKTYKGITNIMSDAYIEANYYTNNSLNAEYVNKFENGKQNRYVTEKLAKIELTNEQIEQTVASNKIASDNDKQELLQRFDNYAPANEITRVENKVTQLQTDTYTKTQIDTKLVDGSVEKVKTLLVIVDDDGTTWDKSDSKVKTNVDADGMEILDKTGSSETALLRAQYDAKKGETVVETKNLYVQKYFVVADTCRQEKYTRADGKKGVGAFYIGG